jgi:hypothetical protein
MTVEAETESKPLHDGAPPFFGSWKRFYAAVLVELLLLVIAFYFFTELFR